MFIENRQYRTDNLSVINDLRRILFSLYGNVSNIENLENIISRNIECIDIEFSFCDFSFIVKIKKTAMKKIRGFKHTPEFYYQIISNIFKEFVSSHEQEILQALRIQYTDPYSVLQILYAHHSIMANLCHVTCIHDNILLIKL